MPRWNQLPTNSIPGIHGIFSQEGSKMYKDQTGAADPRGTRFGPPSQNVIDATTPEGIHLQEVDNAAFDAARQSAVRNDVLKRSQAPTLPPKTTPSITRLPPTSLSSNR